jgi:hypothetical protein
MLNKSDHGYYIEPFTGLDVVEGDRVRALNLNIFCTEVDSKSLRWFIAEVRRLVR